MTPELEILRSPRRAFAHLVASPARVSPLAAAYRPTIALLTMATAAAIASTAHVSVELVASLAACYSVLLALQLAAVWITVPAVVRRQFGTARTIDLSFSGHAPWSIWLLLFAGWALLAPPASRDVRWPLTSMVVPLAWNAFIVFAFFRAGLALPHRGALRRTLAHQAITLGVGFAAFALAVAIWPRILGTIFR